MERWQLKAQAKESLRGRWGQFALYTLIVVIITLICNAGGLDSELDISEIGEVTFRLLGSLWNPFAPLKMLLVIAGQLLAGFFIFGYVDMFIKTRAGMPCDMTNLFRPFKAMPDRVICERLIMLLLQVVYSLLNFVLAKLLGPFSFIPCAALAVFYWILTMRLAFVPVILLENPYTTVPDAFIQSYYVMRGYTWRYFVLNISFLGWILLGALSCGIAYFWILPYIWMTNVNFYYDIKARQLGEQRNESEEV